MMRKFLSASVATALLVGSVSPAMAQSFMTDLQAPMGATATVNFKVPLGAAPARERKATYGLTLGYGQQINSLTADGRPMVRQARLADFRFTDGFKLHKAEVASFDLANLDKDRRLNMGPDSGKDSTTWIIIGLVVAGAVVCVAADCFGGDDDDDEDESP
jgi:hypothetical protein